MKRWSRKWKSSKQPRKQRKYRYNAPLHVKGKFLSAHLSKELIKKHNKRAVPLREGDEVEIVRGKYKKKRGRISRVDSKKMKVYIDGITRKRVAGTEVTVGFEASNLRVVNLNLGDKKRLKTLNKTLKEDRNEKTSESIRGTKVLEGGTKEKALGSGTKTGSS